MFGEDPLSPVQAVLFVGSGTWAKLRTPCDVSEGLKAIIKLTDYWIKFFYIKYTKCEHILSEIWSKWKKLSN